MIAQMHVKVRVLAACSPPGSVCLLDLMLAMHKTKWPTTYTWYLALQIQLLPEPHSPFSFHLGCSYAHIQSSDHYIRGSARSHLN